MDEIVKNFVLTTAVVAEAAAGALIAFAIVRAIYLLVFSMFKPTSPLLIRFMLGRWLTVSLEFLLAADILRTAIAPTWTEIGQLASIIVLRTALNFFLEREIKEGAKAEAEGMQAISNGPAPHGLDLATSARSFAPPSPSRGRPFDEAPTT